jgi:hypothetical protein
MIIASLDLLRLSAWHYATLYLHGLSEWKSVLIMIHTSRIDIAVTIPWDIIWHVLVEMYM